MPKLQSNGISLSYEIQGRGVPILLITGLGYGAWFWRRIAPLLAERFAVISFDNRGAGDSDKPDGPYTLPMLAADSAGLLDSLGIRGAIVFGHSLGGLIAQELVWARPDLVSRLILGATLPGGPKGVPVTPQALAVMQELANAAAQGADPADIARRAVLAACPPGFAEARPEIVQAMIDYRLTNPVPPAQYQAQMAASLGALQMLEEEVVCRLAGIAIPTLILDAEHDLVVPVANGALLAALIPSAQRVILSGCGHRYPLEEPGATAGAIIGFCTQR